MKKLVLILGIVFVTMSSFTTISSTNSSEEAGNACTLYADFWASQAAANGGNYYQVWFHAYAECTRKLPTEY